MDVGPIIETISKSAYYSLPIMALAANLIPGLPEEIFVIAVGYAALVGAFPMWLGFLLVMPALVLSDNMLYWFSRGGNKMVYKVAHKVFGSLVTDHLDLAAKRQVLILVGSRFLFQARFLGPFLCGVTKMNWKKFLIIDILAVSAYVWTMFGVALLLKQRFSDINDGAGLVVDILSVIAIGVLAIIAVTMFKKFFVRWVAKFQSGTASLLGITKVEGIDSDTKQPTA